MDLQELPTPNILVDLDKMDRNLRSMQDIANQAGIELWPHLKTHKMREVWKRQRALGAQGATCSKISEAEAVLDRDRVFLGYPLAGSDIANRITNLYSKVAELILAATSLEQFRILEQALAAAQLPKIGILLGIDSGLGREGVRTPEASRELAQAIRKSPHTRLIGAFTHEGHVYSGRAQEIEGLARQTYQRMRELAEAADCADSLWPGCAITARYMAGFEGVRAIRPGTYVFGDLNLSVTAGVMAFQDIALTILATVVDRPSSELALVDAGSKTLSSDKTLDGVVALTWPDSSCEIRRVSEEHGLLTGKGISQLRVGDRVRLVPAHVCPTVNLARKVYCRQDSALSESWVVDAGGCSI